MNKSKELVKSRETGLEIGTQKANDLIESIVKDFVEGIDFGYAYEGALKKSLTKAGSEKPLLRFMIRPEFIKDAETIEMLKDQKNLIAYICRLYSRKDNQLLGEGRGAVQAGEKKSLVNLNSCIKIAQKRAQVDAVLRLFALSDRFVQTDDEVEDIKKDKGKRKIKVDHNGVVEL